MITWTLTSSAQNSNYISNRKPLINTPFVTLPMGSIQAKGWLETQLLLQKEGLTGYSEIIYKELKSDAAWLGGNAPNSDWERPPYYVKGLVALAYVLDDPELKKKAQKWIDWTLNSQRPDGNFGPISNNDWWPRMPMITALMDYADATNDPRIKPFLTKYFQYQLKTLDSRPLKDWANCRAADNVDVIFWLYNRTGDASLLELADKIKNQIYNYSNIFMNNLFITDFHGDFYPKHGVNVEQAFKYPPVFYQRTKNSLDRDAFLNGVSNLKPYHTQITGMNSCTEFLSGNSSIQGVELCSTVERMFSDEIATKILGEAAIGDELEKIAFNQLPAALSDSIHQHQYYTLPNQVQSKEGKNGFGQDYANGVMPGPFSGYPCCRFNMHMGWPKYVQYCWMATSDNGLAVTAFAPSVVNAKVATGVQVAITEETNYPFEEQIRFSMKLQTSVKFPMKFRIPGWCSSPVIKVNGKEIKGITPGTYFSLNRKWGNGDLIVLELPMKITTSTWVNNSVGIERGPLVYSLKMKENWKLKNKYTFEGKDFSEYEVFPMNEWNYGLILDRVHPESSIQFISGPMPDNPFSPETAPVKLLVKAKKIPSWGLDAHGFHASEPPLSPVASKESDEELTLIPFGAERIRLTYFPEIGNPSASPSSFSDHFPTNGPNKWVNFGGGWQQKDGKYYSESYNVKGAKSIATSTDFANLMCDVKVIILNDQTQAGLLFRVTNPAYGADSYDGYYAGISTTGEIILGKADHGWHQLAKADFSINKGETYHLRIVANGSEIKVYVEDMNLPKIAIIDNSFSNGSFGLRQYCGSNTPDPSGQTVIFEDVSANKL